MEGDLGPGPERWASILLQTVRTLVDNELKLYYSTLVWNNFIFWGSNAILGWRKMSIWIRNKVVCGSRVLELSVLHNLSHEVKSDPSHFLSNALQPSGRQYLLTRFITNRDPTSFPN